MDSNEKEYREHINSILKRFMIIMDVTEEDIDLMHTTLIKCKQKSNNFPDYIIPILESEKISEKVKRLIFFVMGIGCSEVCFEEIYNVKFE